MYSVLIADGEASVRNSLKSMIDWEDLGFAPCKEARSGQEALRLLLAEQPALALVDMDLPQMQGLEVIRAAREQNFRGRFIVLSRYSDFHLALEAIRLGVTDYLSKPIEQDSLFSALQRVKAALAQEQRVWDHTECLKRKSRDILLRELVTGIYDADVTVSPQDLASLELTADVYQAVICENFTSPADSTAYNFADLLNVANREEHTFYSFEWEGRNVILLKGTYALNRFRDFLKHYQGEAPPQKGSPMDMFFLAYGRPVHSAGEIPLSYQDAAHLIARRFFCAGGQHTLGYEELSSQKENGEQLALVTLGEYADALTGYLQTFNRRKVSEALLELESRLCRADNDVQELKLFLIDFYLRVREKISLIYHTMSIPFPAHAQAIRRIAEASCLREIMDFLREQSELFMEAAGSPDRNSVLDDILYYIDHNYQSNIRLETIAPLFGYNSAYLGKIFNQTVGENFNSYVDHLRIEHSKQLLLQNRLKVYEVAEQVGYRNVDYFHKKFRKYVGESPAEFRKTALRQKEKSSL